MKRWLFLFFILIATTFCAFAQYVNTDELVFLAGSEKPISFTNYKVTQDSIREANKGYLADFMLPGNGGYVISRFGPRSGRMHYGTDLKMHKGDTVVASQSGEIVRANWGRGFGRIVVIQHKNKIQTYYAHLSAFLVAKGYWVAKGEPIGLAGSTGRSRGNHLHFEMREDGRPFDSELVFDYKKGIVRADAFEMESLAALHKKMKPVGYSNKVAVPEYYRVRSGDSLWTISRRFKTSMKQICKLNKITEKSVLRIGQPLKLY